MGRTISLSAMASEVPGVVSYEDAEVFLSDVTHDSRRAGPHTVFVAIVGMTTDGHRFVPAAVAAGSPVVVVQRPEEVAVPSLVVADSREAMAYVAASVHGHPARSMTMVGVTGTNGKTTVGAMCEAALGQAERSTGIVGTLGARIDGEPIPLARTTPESTDLQRLLGAMRDGSVDTVVMEVSSHALELHRSDAIVFDVGAFTNLSQDHLDFHRNMESYFLAKAKLFEQGRAKHAIFNVTDPAGRRLADSATVPATTVGVGVDADLVATIRDQSAAGTRFAIEFADGTVEVDMPLAGSFNVANAAVAYAICRHIGVPPDAIVAGLEGIGTIPGRMESVDDTADITVIVDYAHTPAAVATVVEAAAAMAAGSVITVIGAGGDRDQEKRPMMGAAAARHSNLTIVTSDNPRSEDPERIVDSVADGAEAQLRGSVERIVDRSQAIAHAISIAEPNDVVLILGRGHERTQEVKGEFVPFSDVDVARSALAARAADSS